MEIKAPLTEVLCRKHFSSHSAYQPFLGQENFMKYFGPCVSYSLKNRKKSLIDTVSHLPSKRTRHVILRGVSH